MTKKNEFTNEIERRAWFRRKIVELGEALKRLPADRLDLLDPFDGGKDAGATAPEKTCRAAPPDINQPADCSENNNNPGAVSDIRAVKCNPINSRSRGKKRR